MVLSRVFSVVAAIVLFGACQTTTDTKQLAVEDAKVASVSVDSINVQLAKIYADQKLDLGQITEKLTGKLYKPKGMGPFPGVVVVHGCGGVDARHSRWGEWYARNGVVALIVDGYGPRGETNTCRQSTKRVSSGKRVSDAYGGAKVLAGLPFVDPARIGVMGNSNGGRTVLEAVHERFPGIIGDSLPRLAFAIGLYPPCGADGKMVGPSYAPLLILIGEADDYTVADKCVRGVKKDGKHKIPAELKVYPGGYHGFDSDYDDFFPDLVNVNAPSGRGASIRKNEAILAKARQDILGFLQRHRML